MKFAVPALVAALVLSACGSSEQKPDQPDQPAAGADADPAGEVIPVPAGGYFKLAAGLWERKVTPMSDLPPIVERICVGDATRAQFIPINEGRGLVGDCKLTMQNELSMFGVSFEMQCSKPRPTKVGGNMSFKDNVLNGILNIEGGSTGAGDKLPPYAGVKTVRVGDCPSNMKPGDIADPSGKIVGRLGG
ncbi:hypothetical protein FHS95_003963 [Sphingomonas naasensis]|uniref:DUF3617 family protein n=1 Tax=Sphingomonas naasensis TaxID=1344951 RepID=A0A4S1WGD3_9SPHN|nr:hypothetical protein [Sphingomonas naasensis]NIJ22248.1 hypothetical protein [Sphingomonas naasensis]TGX40737.1 hypothetical protein E5A74_14715 [Sphingomonas naasensis]